MAKAAEPFTIIFLRLASALHSVKLSLQSQHFLAGFVAVVDEEVVVATPGTHVIPDTCVADVMRAADWTPAAAHVFGVRYNSVAAAATVPALVEKMKEDLTNQATTKEENRASNKQIKYTQIHRQKESKKTKKGLNNN